MVDEVRSTAKTTETSLRVLEALVEEDGATIEVLSERLGLAPSTVHRHLAAFRKYGYVVRDGAEYGPSLRFLTVGGHVQRTTPYFPAIKEKVDALAEETGERAQFIVEENGERVYLYTEVGASAVQTGAHVGKRGPLHTSAAGKAIMAKLPNERVEAIVDEHGLASTGPNAITSPGALRDAFDRIRERGYAFNREESTGGVHAVGSAVTNADGTVLGALSVSGPASRVKDERLTVELPEVVLAAVNELELHINHSVH